MSLIARFGEYAAAFEKAYATDDWSALDPYLTDDVRYDAPLPAPYGGRPEGRDAVVAYLKRVVDMLDRRFETRRLELLEGPTEAGDSVRIKGSAIYTAAGVPDLVLTLEETAHFEGDRIRLLADVYAPEQIDAALAYIREHGSQLGIPEPD